MGVVSLTTHTKERLMESAENTVVDSTSKRSKRCSGRYGADFGRKGSWTGYNIAAMVLGFVFFWPVGLVILYWIIRGRDVRDLPAAAREKWSAVHSRPPSLVLTRSLRPAGSSTFASRIVYIVVQKLSS